MKITFTKHAEKRILIRKITEEEIIDAIKFPDIHIKKHEKYYVQKKLQRGIIEIVYEKTGRYIKVITIYWL